MSMIRIYNDLVKNSLPAGADINQYQIESPDEDVNKFVKEISDIGGLYGGKANTICGSIAIVINNNLTESYLVLIKSTKEEKHGKNI